MSKWKNPDLGRFNGILALIRNQLPPLNFITIHYSYFIGTCLLSAIIFWGSSTPFRSVTFTNSLFLTVSAMTGTGLNTINLSTLNTFQQFHLFLLIFIGSPIFVSAFVVQVRRSAFERRFKLAIDEREKRRQRGRSKSTRRRWSLSSRTKSSDAQNAPEDGSQRTEPTATDEQRGDAPSPLRATSDEADDSSNSKDRSHSQDRSSETPDLAFEAIPRSSKANFSPSGAIKFSEDTRFGPGNIYDSPHRQRSGFFTMNGVGAEPSSSLHPTSPVRAAVSSGVDSAPAVPVRQRYKQKWESLKFETTGGRVARNSQFHGLTEKERERLGGYEYRAVSFLAWVVPAYVIMWQLLGCLGCAAWIAANRPGTARTNGLNPWWVGAFNAVSAFNNSGMSLLDANMTAYQTAYYLLITMGLLILAGNTCYPVFLRLIVWSMYKFAKSREEGSEEWSERARTLRFLLDHPRRCYTNMFPSRHTWWLLLSVIALNGIDWAAFEILNLGNRQIDSVLPTGVRVIDGLFQAISVRSGGFYVVAIPSVRISLQVLYVVMMYISVYPVTITMRNSNVYEERSLGIYADDQEDVDEARQAAWQSNDEKRPGVLSRISTHLVTGGANLQESNGRFVRQQLRAQLAHDTWLIVLALFLIMIIESGEFERDPADYSVFNFIFEIVSAYGCVGISIGIPGQDYSFCGSWRILSKLILCVVMLRGRHRGLPVAIDKAILLPGEQNWIAEEDDGRIRLARTRTLSRGRQETV